LALLMYFEVLEPTGPTTTTTFMPAAAAGVGFVDMPPNATMASASERTVRRNGPEDARWAPCLGNGNSLASSPPEHRAGAQ
jgi:hypothetical protein